MTILQISQILPVIIPLVAALLCSMRNNYFYNSILSIMALLFGLIVSIFLLSHVVQHGELTYKMGNWDSSYGIQLKLSVLNAVMLNLVNFITFVVSIYSAHMVKYEINKRKFNLFYTAFLLCHAGLVGIIITNDIFNLYVFLEISSLATYTLVASAGTRKSYIAAFDYLIIGTISATFYLIGVGFLYSITGTLNMDILSNKIPDVYGSRIAQVGIIFIIIGIAIKSALFPLHLWLTKAYGNSNSIVASFLSGTSTKVGIYILIKFIYFIIGADLIFQNPAIRGSFITLAICAILFGAIYALIQESTKKLLAYSSVSQIGYVVLAICLGLNLVAALLQIIADSIAKTSMFMIDGCSVNERRGGKNLYFIISALSIIGFPLTVGFIGKLYLFDLTIDTHHYISSFVIALSSAITALYVWRLNKIIKTSVELPYILHLPLFMCCILNVGIGICPSPVINILKLIAI